MTVCFILLTYLWFNLCEGKDPLMEFFDIIRQVLTVNRVTILSGALLLEHSLSITIG